MLEELTRGALKAVGTKGPVLSVCLDVSRNDEAGAGEVRQRWQAQERRLRAAGAPEDLLRRVGALVTDTPGRGGEAGRLVVAAVDDLQLDVVFPGRPVRDESTWGALPQLLPLVRAAARRAGYVLALVDRTGADLEVVDVLDHELAKESVAGSNDELHKVPGGFLSSRRIQARVEDSWARNAAEVAKQLDAVVREYRPAVVLVDGDETVVGDLLKAVEGNTRSLMVQLNTGGRADGISVEHRRAAVAQAVADRRREVLDRALDDFRRGEATQGAAVQGLDAVVDGLRREQVQTLLLADDPTSTLSLWVGDEPGQLAGSEAELRSLGVDEPHKVRADAGLVWAALATGADVQLVDREDSEFTGGVAAVLRWSDRSTPHDLAPSMPGHGDVRHHRADEA